MTSPMPQRYLLIIVPFLLLWGCLATDSVEHEHINKRLKSQDQPDEKGSTRTNPMSLDFLIHPSDDQEPRSKLSYSPEKNPELVYPQRHSGKRKQLDCDISPESDQATSHCVRFDSIHSSESNLYSNDQPQSSSVPGSPSRVGYHHSHTNQALLDSEILEQSNKLKEQRSNLSREMHLFLVEQYTLPGIVRPRSKKLRGHWLDLLLGEYYTSGNSKLKEEVQRILTGPVQEGLGDKFPSNILRLEYMEYMLNSAEANCESYKNNARIVPTHSKTVDENINRVFNTIVTRKGVSTFVALRTLFVTGNGLYVKDRISSKVGSNTIIGIIFKRNATDSLQVRFIWLPNNENYTCEVFKDHHNRHYYFVRPFVLYEYESVEHTLVAFLLRFYDRNFTN